MAGQQITVDFVNRKQECEAFTAPVTALLDLYRICVTGNEKCAQWKKELSAYEAMTDAVLEKYFGANQIEKKACRSVALMLFLQKQNDEQTFLLKVKEDDSAFRKKSLKELSEYYSHHLGLIFRAYYLTLTASDEEWKQKKCAEAEQLFQAGNHLTWWMGVKLAWSRNAVHGICAFLFSWIYRWVTLTTDDAHSPTKIRERMDEVRKQAVEAEAEQNRQAQVAEAEQNRQAQVAEQKRQAQEEKKRIAAERGKTYTDWVKGFPGAQEMMGQNQAILTEQEVKTLTFGLNALKPEENLFQRTDMKKQIQEFNTKLSETIRQAKTRKTQWIQKSQSAIASLQTIQDVFRVTFPSQIEAFTCLEEKYDVRTFETDFEKLTNDMAQKVRLLAQAKLRTIRESFGVAGGVPIADDSKADADDTSQTPQYRDDADEKMSEVDVVADPLSQLGTVDSGLASNDNDLAALATSCMQIQALEQQLSSQKQALLLWVSAELGLANAEIGAMPGLEALNAYEKEMHASVCSGLNKRIGALLAHKQSPSNEEKRGSKHSSSASSHSGSRSEQISSLSQEMVCLSKLNPGSNDYWQRIVDVRDRVAALAPLGKQPAALQRTRTTLSPSSSQSSLLDGVQEQKVDPKIAATHTICAHMFAMQHLGDPHSFTYGGTDGHCFIELQSAHYHEQLPQYLTLLLANVQGIIHQNPEFSSKGKQGSINVTEPEAFLKKAVGAIKSEKAVIPKDKQQEVRNAATGNGPYTAYFTLMFYCFCFEENEKRSEKTPEEVQRKAEQALLIQAHIAIFLETHPLDTIAAPWIASFNYKRLPKSAWKNDTVTVLGCRNFLEKTDRKGTFWDSPFEIEKFCFTPIKRNLYMQFTAHRKILPKLQTAEDLQLAQARLASHHQ